MTQETQGPAAAPGMAWLVVALAAGVGGLILLDEQLQSSRPKEAASFPMPSATEETVEARLWQDPLQAIQSDWDYLVEYTLEQERLPPSMAAPPTLKSMRDSVAEKSRPLLVVAALVNGGPYADDAENRRRNRYALISALTGADYVPYAPQRVGYFLSPQFALPDRNDDKARLEKLCHATSDRATRCPLKDPVTLIGFEWFQPRPRQDTSAPNALPPDQPKTRTTPFVNPPPKSVLVLWLNSGNSAGFPLRHIHSLLQEIVPGWGAKQRNIRVAVIGPSDSEDLEHMYRRAEDTDGVEKTATKFSEQVYRFPQHSEELLLELITQLRPGGQKPDCAPSRLDPDPSQLDSAVARSVQHSVENLVDTIDHYLDYGLPSEVEQSLRPCLGDNPPREKLSECLAPNRSSSSTIVDSDPRWRETVVSLRYGYPNTEYPEDTAALIRSVANGSCWIRSLLIATHVYLDYGLPNLRNPKALHDCLVKVSERSSKNADADLRSELSDCLDANLPTEDLDTEWYSTVAKGWLDTNGGIQAFANNGDSSRQHSEHSRSSELPFDVFSPRSTVPLSMLLGRNATDFPESSVDWDDQVRRRLNVRSFRSVLARDDAVLQAVVKELNARGLEVSCTGQPNVAVVSELDSHYGRFMRSILQDAIDNQRPGFCEQEVVVDFFGYLRGVDGEVPVADGDNASWDEVYGDGQPNAPQPAGWFFPAFESPTGPTQVDYIRRLADRVGRIHAEQSNHGTGFRAIGVFGADIYDKQLILQALRERLPSVTFFTTDLDARLADPSEYRWNRNLIVGSAYGLWPERGHQRGHLSGHFEVPPFRDSYQTAVFSAVRMALTDNGNGSLKDYRPPPPRLFEIGRSGAIDITARDQTGPPRHGQGEDSSGGKDSPRFDHDTYLQVLRTLALLAPLFVLALVSFSMSRQLPDNSHTSRAHKRVVILAVLSAVFISQMLYTWRIGSWEPLLLFEGISAVPTLALHLTVTIYAISFVIIGAGRIAQSTEDIVRDFGLNSGVQRLQFGAGVVWRTFQLTVRSQSVNSLAHWSREIAKNQQPINKKNVHEIWEKYHVLGRCEARLARVLPWVVAWTLLVWFMVSRDASPLLARHIGFEIEIVRTFTFFFALIAVFLCTDALRLGQVYIQALVAGDIAGWNTSPKVNDEVDSRWQTMQLIAAHTSCVSPLIVLPFVLVFLLLLARSTIFDGWIWSPTLLAIYAGFSAYLLTRALLFQRTANQSRQEILDDLDLYRRMLTNRGSMMKKADLVMDNITCLHSGAFVPWTRHPILQSIALPSSGVGLLALLNAIFG